MATTGDILVDGNGTSPRNWTAQDYTTIDEAVGTGGDSDYIGAQSDNNNNDTSFTLEDMPSDFGNMDSAPSAYYHVRYRVTGRAASRPDTYGISLRIMSGATVLAADDSGGTFQVENADVTSSSFASSSVTAFTYTNTSATKTQWNAATVEFRQTYSKSGGPDGGQIEIASFDFNGVYTAAAATTSQAILIT